MRLTPSIYTPLVLVVVAPAHLLHLPHFLHLLHFPYFPHLLAAHLLAPEPWPHRKLIRRPRWRDSLCWLVGSSYCEADVGNRTALVDVCRQNARADAGVLICFASNQMALRMPVTMVSVRVRANVGAARQTGSEKVIHGPHQWIGAEFCIGHQ